jgi:hypothetical protein
LRRLRTDLAISRVRLPRLFRLTATPGDTVARLPERNVLPYETDRIVGAGHPESIRTITIAIDRPAKNATVRHLAAHDLLDYIADHVEDQGRDRRPTHGIPRLDVALVLAVHATEWTRHDAAVTRDQINACADHSPTGAAERAYVRAMSTTWDGQVIVSVFVYVALEGRYLRVSILPHILPPIVPELRIVDVIENYHPLAQAGYAAVDATKELVQIGGRIRRIGRPETDTRSKKRRKEHNTHAELASVREVYA